MRTRVVIAPFEGEPFKPFTRELASRPQVGEYIQLRMHSMIAVETGKPVEAAYIVRRIVVPYAVLDADNHPVELIAFVEYVRPFALPL